MAVEVVHHEPVAHEAPPAPAPRGIRRFTRPGWLRALWMTPLGYGIATALVCGIRYGAHWDPVWDLEPLVTAWTIITPLLASCFRSTMTAFSIWLIILPLTSTSP